MYSKKSKKNSLKVTTLALTLIISLMFSVVSVEAATPWPKISTSTPIKTYTISTKNNTTAYADVLLTKKCGTVYSSDELYIYAIGYNSRKEIVIKCSYPVKGGRKHAVLPLSAITSAKQPVSVGTATSSITVYRRSNGSSKLGTIYKNDIVYQYSSNSGSRTQVMYNTGSAKNPDGWKLGWINKSSFDKYVKSNAEKVYNPEGCVDSVSSPSDGMISVGGWTFDRSDLSKKLEVHVYVGGPAGSGAPGYSIKANKYRKDVANAYAGVSSYHGFSSTIKVSKTGTQKIYIYAINVGSGTNVLLATKTVNIKGKETGSGFKIKGVDIGYQPGDYFTDNGKACTDHNKKGVHSYFNEAACNCICTYKGKSLGAVQCYGFSRYVQSKLYGVNSYDSPKQFYKLSNAYVPAGKLTSAKLKSIILSAEVGAHLRTNGSAHSFIITDITPSGFSIIQCNGSNNREYSVHSACRIGTYSYTWSSYVNSTYGKRGISFVEIKK